MFTYDEELKHHGTKNMKWGVRRYQNKDGSLTPEGRKRYAKDASTDKKEVSKSETTEEKKARLTKTRDPKEIYKNRTLFSKQEIQDLYLAMNYDKQIKGLIPPKEPNKLEKTIDFVNKWVGKATTLADTGTKAYESYKKVIGVLEDMEKRSNE